LTHDVRSKETFKIEHFGQPIEIGAD